MKNLFDDDTVKAIKQRIDKLQSTTQPQWGKMDVAQMLAHCSAFQDMAMGKSNAKRSWLGLLIGKFVKPIFYNDKPLPRDMSTIPFMLISDKRDFETEKQRLNQQVMTFQSNGQEKCTTHPHPFFRQIFSRTMGKMMLQAS